jgi:1-acyl-sn-glycerol-3-phosphate acyltransferase
MDTIDQFHDIRPYHDDEVRGVLDSLLRDEGFIRSIAAFSFPRLHRLLPKALQHITRLKLTRQLKNVHDVASMQSVIAFYMDDMIEKTTSGLTHSGLENLQEGRSYLFISNHRDIAMDPAFVNYMLYHAGYETVYIAIGDNLLKRPFVNDLMRLNRSFIVRRSLKGRELLKSSKQLSEYIHHCIEHKRNVWIAQREGRAKDGVDRTDTALLKMLALARRGEGLKESLSALHIIPVAISYEFDPCDALKANELYQKKEVGYYAKDEQSDIQSIVKGMVGYKGHVHVSFGKELQLSTDDVDEAAALIDQQITNHYLLQGSNHYALEKLQETAPHLVPSLQAMIGSEAIQSAEMRAEFDRRLAAADEKTRLYMLSMYANPVISRFAVASEPFPEGPADTNGDVSSH